MELKLDETLQKAVEVLKAGQNQVRPNVLDSLKLDQAIRLAKKKAKEESPEDSKRIYNDILTKFPKNKRALDGIKSLSGGFIGKVSMVKEPPQDQQQRLINLYQQGQLQQALNSVKQLLSQFPNSLALYNIQGAANAGLGKFSAAIDSYKQALKIKPDYASAYNNMGIALMDKGDLEAAIDSYKQALKIKPDYANPYNNMGIALKDKGDLEAAIDSYKQALKIKPDYADAYNNMGGALQNKGDPDAAIDSYKQALKIKPDFVEAFYNMGNSLEKKGELQAAIDSFKQALKIKPDYQASLARKLHLQSHICDWAGLEQDSSQIGLLGTKKEPVEPWGLLAFEDSPALHRIRSEIFTVSLYGNIQPLKAAPRPNEKPKKLRIGYFSADFHLHPVAYLIAKVLEVHDRNQFEIYGYSIGPTVDDNMRKRITKSLDVFINVKGMNDREIALLARNDKIDIAIDLTGYTNNNRAGIFAYRAAPVQMNYLGYPVTMGADFIDYIIADLVLIPSGNEHYYSEQILRLPHSYMPADNSRKISVRQMSRYEMGLPEAGFVFCCFNNNYKISPREFDMWMGILLKVEGSVLWLRNSNAWSEDNLCMEAEIRGVDPSRLIFAGRVPMEEHLARHKLADLFLDTFNVNAHTTASEALWAGLPIVTMAGKGSTSRAAASLLTAVGLPELITQTEKDYETLILQLANHPEQLTQIRQKLADNRLSTPLFDTELYTKHLEDGYQQAYQRYFDGKLPKAILCKSSSR
jgi:protein O-GlcNAc transferase